MLAIPIALAVIAATAIIIAGSIKLPYAHETEIAHAIKVAVYTTLAVLAVEGMASILLAYSTRLCGICRSVYIPTLILAIASFLSLAVAVSYVLVSIDRTANAIARLPEEIISTLTRSNIENIKSVITNVVSMFIKSSSIGHFVIGISLAVLSDWCSTLSISVALLSIAVAGIRLDARWLSITLILFVFCTMISRVVVVFSSLISIFILMVGLAFGMVSVVLMGDLRTQFLKMMSTHGH